jgi:hypothetical protein
MNDTVQAMDIDRERLLTILEQYGIGARIITLLKAMIVTGGKIIARQSTPAYKRRMTGEGLTHRAKKRRKIACPICDKEVNEGYLADHLRVIHGRRQDYKENDREGDAAEIAAVVLEAALDEEANAPEVTYRCSMATPRCLGVCPKCDQAIFDRNRMRHHFMHRHLNDKIIIEEEGEFPRCPSCGLFGRHP